MTNFMSATIEEKVPADKMKEIERRHSFSFTYQNQKCTCGIEGGILVTDASEEARSDLGALVGGFEELEKRAGAMPEMEMLEFLYKFFKMKYRFLREVKKCVVFEVIDEKPLDLENMPLKDRCLYEVLEEQSERARKNGTDTFTITKEMLDEKIKTRNAAQKQ
jgi:hypothetical protein